MHQPSGVTRLPTDHLGTTSVTSGASSSTQTYYTFGAVRTTNGTLPTDYTFTGQKFDASDTLMYYGARYYDAAIGRFTQPDSIVPNLYNPQDLDRYAYARNNPLRYTDPTGHFACPDGWCMTEEEGIAAQTTTPPIPTGLIEPAGENQGCRGRCNVPDQPATTGGDQTQHGTTPAPPQLGGNGVQRSVQLPNGTLSIGFCGSVSFPIQLVGCFNAVNIDSQGNLVLGGLTGGGGGATGINGSLVVHVQITNAADVHELGGPYVNAGLAAGEGLGGGVDANFGRGSKGQIIGFTGYFGLTGRADFPLPPVEFHGNATGTWLFPNLHKLW